MVCIIKLDTNITYLFKYPDEISNNFGTFIWRPKLSVYECYYEFKCAPNKPRTNYVEVICKDGVLRCFDYTVIIEEKTQTRIELIMYDSINIK